MASILFLGMKRNLTYFSLMFSAIVFMQVGLKKSRPNPADGITSPTPIDRDLSLDNKASGDKPTERDLEVIGIQNEDEFAVKLGQVEEEFRDWFYSKEQKNKVRLEICFKKHLRGGKILSFST